MFVEGLEVWTRKRQKKLEELEGLDIGLTDIQVPAYPPLFSKIISVLISAPLLCPYIFFLTGKCKVGLMVKDSLCAYVR